MSLTKYNPNSYRPTSFGNLLDNFFDDRFQGGTQQVDFVPNVDIVETEKAFEIQMTIPGVKKSDVTISVENDQLSISGERVLETETKERNFHSIENLYGKFHRLFKLPEIVNFEKIDAKQENGVLRIALPKDEKKTAKKLIEVG